MKKSNEAWWQGWTIKDWVLIAVVVFIISSIVWAAFDSPYKGEGNGEFSQYSGQ